MACNFRRNPNPNRETTFVFPPIANVFLASNTITTIYRAYARGDYYTIAFIIFEYSAFLLLELCSSALRRMPPRDRSKQKKLLQLAVWVSFTAVVFGFSVYFGPFFSDPDVGFSLYVISLVGSALIFYVYVIIWDERSGCDDGLGEEYYEVYIWEEV